MSRTIIDSNQSSLTKNNALALLLMSRQPNDSLRLVDLLAIKLFHGTRWQLYTHHTLIHCFNSFLHAAAILWYRSRFPILIKQYTPGLNNVDSRSAYWLLETSAVTLTEDFIFEGANVHYSNCMEVLHSCHAASKEHGQQIKETETTGGNWRMSLATRPHCGLNLPDHFIGSTVHFCTFEALIFLLSQYRHHPRVLPGSDRPARDSTTSPPTLLRNQYFLLIRWSLSQKPGVDFRSYLTYTCLTPPQP